MDPTLLREMRRSQAEDAFVAGDFDRSIVEADELLYEDPDNPGALWILARSALAVGNAFTARAALDHLLDLDESMRPVPTSHIQTELAFAHFLSADFEVARATASSALTMDRDLAAAWVCLGLAEERLGHADLSEEAFRRAEALQPNAAPKRLPSPSAETWQRLLQTAVQHLSEDEGSLIRGLAVEWETWPQAEILRSATPPLSPFIDVLISGDGSEPANPVDQLDAALQQLVPSPSTLTVFTANLLRGQPSTADLVDRLVASIRAELASWLGIPASDLEPDPV